jgi:hypothetical protein
VVAEGATPPPPSGSEISIASGASLTAAAIAHSAPVPAGYTEYTNAQYGFSFYYEPGARITAYDEGGGASTLVYEDFARARGFQIFIVPYAEPKVSDERFREDVPSGVRENIEATTLDGVPAVTFTSQDAMLGATREIWALRNGHLFEITTFSGAGDWFIPIIESWQWLQ